MSTLVDYLFNTAPVDPERFASLGAAFAAHHRDPLNVLAHLVTTPLGLVGAFGLLRTVTKSSSTSVFLSLCYLASLLPLLHTGEFFGTALLLVVIIFTARSFRITLLPALVLFGLSYVLQDLAHAATGESTFQSTYSGGENAHIDLSHPLQWAQHLGEHMYFLLPLLARVTLPLLPLPPAVRDMLLLDAPLPQALRRLHVCAWLLGPLLVFALGAYNLDSRNNFCFFPGTPYFYRVLHCNLKEAGQVTEDGEKRAITADDEKEAKDRTQDLRTIRSWTMSNNPSENTSSHYWFSELPSDAKSAFDRIANAKKIFSTFRSLFAESHYCMDVLPGMNEIYVSGPERSEEAFNSDHVFFSRHVDGPFGFIPFVSVYRCIVGLDRNMMYTTHYPLANVDINACEGDVIAFDFNREVHYITRDESKKKDSDDFRVTLKLHYCVYPRTLAPLGWLMGWMNTQYNMSFRALFLKTIKPVSAYEHFLAWNVNFNTFLFDRIETLLGLRNVCYLGALAALWWATGVYEIFFALTSFVHYFRYISTFYVRRGIDFGSFKRDVLLLKTVALIQLFYHYFFPAQAKFEWDFVSLAMIASGYLVSVMATNAIGVDRTYFAAELGLVEPKWINKFPYGYIPHPMIVSQIFALLGFHKAAHFRAEWPYVVPIHVTLYLVHMLQEMFDIYQKPAAGAAAQKVKQQ